MVRFTLSIAFILLVLGSLWSQSLSDSNLPIIQITTSKTIESDDKITANMTISTPENGRSNINGPYNGYDGTIGIEFRGSSSLTFFPKKGYALETRDEAGENLNITILGLPEENDWVLHGPYSDKSLIRNALAYSIAGDIMPYAPRIQFCELIINQEYLGVYLFTEKIKRDKNRVVVSKLNPDEIEGEDLTGGYILKFDKWDGENIGGFPSDYPADLGGFGSTYFQYHYPKPDEIVVEQQNYIQGFIKKLENSIKATNYTDPELGYRKYLDTQSFIDLIFVNEISKNVDGYRLSTFMYKDKDSINPKLQMGPVWDFNLAFGNADYCTQGNPEGLVFLDFNEVCSGDNWIVHFWWERLWSDPAFKIELGNRWVELRETILSTDHIVAKIDSFENLLQESQVRNFTKWRTLGQYIWPNYQVYNSFGAEVNGVRTFINQRMPWLDIQFAGLASSNENLLPEEDLLLFPNPCQNQIGIQFNKRELIPEDIKIYDASGNMVLTIKNKGKGELSVDLSGLSTGLHFLIATTKEGKFYNKRFVKN